MKITLIGTNVKYSRSPAIWKSIAPSVEYIVEQINELQIYNSLLKHQHSVINLTAPFKEIGYEWVTRFGRSESGFFGSVNYIYNHKGFSTDGEAVANIAGRIGLPIKKKVLILGTGGTAKAVLGYLLAWIEPKQLHFSGRNKLEMARINYIAQRIIHASGSPLIYSNIDFQAVEDYDFSRYDVVLDCTPNPQKGGNVYPMAYTQKTKEDEFPLLVLREQAVLANNRLRK